MVVESLDFFGMEVFVEQLRATRARFRNFNSAQYLVNGTCNLIANMRTATRIYLVHKDEDNAFGQGGSHRN
jgi:hypothetical protein